MDKDQRIAELIAALDRVDAALIRADGHRARLLAMLDRLAALTVEEVAQTLADCTPGAGWAPDTGGRVTRIERDMAAAVLALVQARVEGPVSVQAPQEGPSGGRDRG